MSEVKSYVPDAHQRQGFAVNNRDTSYTTEVSGSFVNPLENLKSLVCLKTLPFNKIKLFFSLLFYYCFYSVLGYKGISELRLDSICFLLHNPMENNRVDRLRVSIESRGAV